MVPVPVPVPVPTIFSRETPGIPFTAPSHKHHVMADVLLCIGLVVIVTLSVIFRVYLVKITDKILRRRTAKAVEVYAESWEISDRVGKVEEEGQREEEIVWTLVEDENGKLKRMSESEVEMQLEEMKTRMMEMQREMEREREKKEMERADSLDLMTPPPREELEIMQLD
ncbi:hypothetical protein MKZ38_009924 [Zalerion maritima]|uniref:Uncharacterized protein n=1 Tax=Zalerion maritima TaxID=339359 RepID=A0AAD5WT90_9PEZI|nr:hypothetical protein MKZ38_009924 [Zalerion maritima]